MARHAEVTSLRGDMTSIKDDVANVRQSVEDIEAAVDRKLDDFKEYMSQHIASELNTAAKEALKGGIKTEINAAVDKLGEYNFKASRGNRLSWRICSKSFMP